MILRRDAAGVNDAGTKRTKTIRDNNPIPTFRLNHSSPEKIPRTRAAVPGQQTEERKGAPTVRRP
jgi:hypothetical protein